jgi:putative transposase
VHFQCEVEEDQAHGSREIGIDQGLKEQVTCSDGEKYSRENLTKKYEIQLAMAQRAHKVKRVRAIHAKIKNKSKDWMHKITSKLCKSSKTIVLGQIHSKKLAQPRLAKSVLDASWGSFTTLLQYKAIRHGAVVQIVSEKWSTQTCSSCGKIPEGAPKGISALGVRSWRCSECGAEHDRDINAAQNIFNFGAGRCTPTGRLSLQ